MAALSVPVAFKSKAKAVSVTLIKATAWIN